MMSISTEKHTEQKHRATERVLDMLEEADTRMDRLYSNQRKHIRKTFRHLITVIVPKPEESDLNTETGQSCNVWACSISQGGLSFIHPSQIETKQILTGLIVPNSPTVWFQGEIVRERKVPDEGFWEYGVAFHGRVE